jgi:hypothetical protein
MTFSTLALISLVHFLPQTGSLVLNLVVDDEEVDRKPLSEAQPKGK